MAKRKTASVVTNPKAKCTAAVAMGITKPSAPIPPANPLSRSHTVPYHYPLLLSDTQAAENLLTWFESIEEARSMPWRKKWIDPAEFGQSSKELDSLLAKRAYEVWVSEISRFPLRVDRYPGPY